MTAPRTLSELQQLVPDAHIERVGEREELVIYTGMTALPDGCLTPMDDALD